MKKQAARTPGPWLWLYQSPLRLVLILAAALFLTEMIVMLILRRLEGLAPEEAVLLDSTILLLFILPCLYFLVLRPLALHIDQRRRAEEALQTKHARMSEILESIPDAVSIIGPSHEIEYVNNVIEAEYGPVGGRLCYEYFHNASAPCGVCTGKEVFGGKPLRSERVSPITGRIYDLIATPLRNAGGTFSKMEIQRDITDRKRQAEELRESRDRLRSLSLHLQDLREEERRKVAREIHDELGQVLATLQLMLIPFRDGFRGDGTPLVDEAEAMGASIGSAISLVRRISCELRPAMLDDLGLPEALEHHVQAFEKASGIRCETTFLVDEVPRDAATALFRIFQESLTNVIRHAGATKVVAILVEKKGNLVLTVRDNGRGIERDQALHPQAFGVMGMVERVAILGGRLRIRGVAGAGTVVSARIPLRKDDDLWFR